MKRLGRLDDVARDAMVPGYDPDAHGSGIVHIGPGAFHRAHQAVYTDDALDADGGDWRIVAVSLRSTVIADALNPQNGLYTLIERGAEKTAGRVVASIDRVIAGSRDRTAPLDALVDPGIRVVTLTVTEKAYGIDRSAMTADGLHPWVAADLADPQNPSGVLGLIVESLRRRRERDIAAFSVLCCDNLPENGALLRAGVIDFAGRLDRGLAEWIGSDVAFPSSMVDRITPAPTQDTLDEAARLTGCRDLAAVETEPFAQWVIEDRFSGGRPAWEAGGALFVEDVRPYELMKLRMLNGAHSMLAYSGFLAGCSLVRDVMADPARAALVDRHMKAAQATLPALAGFDLHRYRQELADRFANPAIAHQTYQIAMDGTEKMPQRILSPAIDTLKAGGDMRPFAFAVAAWMRYCIGKTDDGTSYRLRDPREDEIGARIASRQTAVDICDALHGLPGLFDRRLVECSEWRDAVSGILGDMLRLGMARAIANESLR